MKETATEAPANKKPSGIRKAVRIILDVITGLFVVCAIFTLAISVVSKKDSDGTATIFGTQLRFVQSDSMAKCDQTDVSEYKIKSIPVKSCVFVEVMPEDENKKEEWLSDIEVGDVLTFKYVITSKQETITHRVVSIVDKDTGGYIITLEGDIKASDTGVLQQVIDTSKTDSPNYIIGKVVGQSYVLGVIIYAFKTPLGIALICIVPCLIIIIFNVGRIIKVCSKDKKEKALVAAKSKDDQIEQLKKELESLKKNETSE